LQDLRVPPGNRLEELHGDPHGEHSIRINDQWRVCFVWRERDAYDVEIMDYHQERCSDEPDQKAATDSSG